MGGFPTRIYAQTQSEIQRLYPDFFKVGGYLTTEGYDSQFHFSEGALFVKVEEKDVDLEGKVRTFCETEKIGLGAVDLEENVDRCVYKIRLTPNH